MSKLVLDNLESQLAVLSQSYKELDDRKDATLIEMLDLAMKGFEVPEGFTVRTKTYEIGIVKEGQHWESARVNIDKERNYETFKREIKVSVNANGGREVDDLLAQADFVRFVTPKLDDIKGLIQDVEDQFEQVLTDVRKDCREVEKAISDVKSAEYQLRIDNVLRQMKSKDGFDVLITESLWGGTDHPILELKRGYSTYNLTNVKITKETASGKSVNVEYLCKLFDGTDSVRTEERVRMSNVMDLVRNQLYREEKVAEGELALAKVEA